MKWYLRALRQYAHFRGRARRKEYWMFSLFNFVFAMAVLYIATLLVPFVYENKLLTVCTTGLICLYSFAVVIPGLAVTVRRLHDIGKSGLYILIPLIPVVGSIWLLVLMMKDGNREENPLGPDPKVAERGEGRNKIQTATVFLILVMCVSIYVDIIRLFMQLSESPENMLFNFNLGAYYFSRGYMLPSYAILFFAVSMLCKDDKLAE